MDHISVVDGVAYCPRHAGVMRAIAHSSAPWERPPIQCRAPSLTVWMAESLGHEIDALVANIGSPGEYRLFAIGLEHVLEERPEHHRWQRSWELAGPNESLMIYVDVKEETDIVVRVRVGEKIVLRIVPPWIEQHLNNLQDEDEARIRNQFCQRVVFMIAQAFEIDGRAGPASLSGVAQLPLHAALKGVSQSQGQPLN